MNVKQLMAEKVKVLRMNLPSCTPQLYELTLDKNLVNAVGSWLVL
jgi:hypothetical protein